VKGGTEVPGRTAPDDTNTRLHVGAPPFTRTSAWNGAKLTIGTALSLSSYVVFWLTTPFIMPENYQRFEGICCLYLIPP
jgi:hypothetical protein